MSRGTLDTARFYPLSCTRLSLSTAGFPKTVPLASFRLRQSVTPWCSHHGFGSFPFARRYSENHCCFLFLRVLRCFSSPGSPCMAMYSPCSDWGSPSRVSPFRNLRLTEYLLLTAAFRSLSRLSSALSAKASALCPSLLDLFSGPIASRYLPWPVHSVALTRLFSFSSFLEVFGILRILIFIFFLLRNDSCCHS